MDFVELEGDPKLRHPRVVAAFRGWNDAGGAASLAAGYLRSVTDAERFAVIDSEPFVDYQQTRPTVSMVDGDVRQVEWPITEVFASRDHDLMIVLGTEPNMRWRAFSDSIADLARRYRRSSWSRWGRCLPIRRTRGRCRCRRAPPIPS